MRTFIAARVSFNSGQAQLDCIIRNISDGGAKLEISSAVTIPDEFNLIIPQKSVNRRVRLCWRSAEFCGVAYLDPADAAPPIEDVDSVEAGLRRQIRRLESTIERMQRRIDELTGG